MEFKTKDGFVVREGSEIYYTGDQANQSGFFKVARIDLGWERRIVVDLEEDAESAGDDTGRFIRGLQTGSFEPGPGRRFKPMELYLKEREDALSYYRQR